MAEAHAIRAADHESGPAIEPGRLGVWLFLGSEVLLFAGLIGSYLFLRTGSREFPAPGGELDRLAVAFNSALLVASSFTVTRAVKPGAPGRRALWLFVTLVLGAIFLALQAHEYTGLVEHGILPRTNLYWSCFFVLTGVHGLHVFGGLVALAFTGPRAIHGRPGIAFELASLYWHFVDVVWILLFTLLYLL
ncbi:MAG: heme-copper oxidase subunit III [Planctomycetes bacterium]|nr:heme-copper oxidase subunit III [Planctomycetota bacterium]